jgi:hypothetical protein
MNGKTKECLFVVCPCGKVKRMGEWVKIEMPFSDFIALALRQNISSFKFPISSCPTCSKTPIDTECHKK